MSNPTMKDVHVGGVLDNVSILFKNQALVADRVFPTVPVSKQKDSFYKFLKGDWFRNEAGVRGPGANARRGGFKLTTDTYNCNELAWAQELPVEALRNSDNVLDLEDLSVLFAKNVVGLRREADLASLIINTGNWTSTNDVEGGWLHTVTTPTFIADMFTGIQTVQELIGLRPNKLLIEAVTWNSIRQLDDVLDRIKYTGGTDDPAKITTKMIAGLFELDEVIVAGAIRSSDEETMAGTEFTAVRLWEVNAGKGSALLYFDSGVPMKEMPSAGYTFAWDRRNDDIEDEILEQDELWLVRKWWEKSPKQWVIEASMSLAPKITGADAGYLFYDTLSS
ncbi:MAG: hypothetical protein PHV85_00050 [Desulfovibrionaceae bacterium]|nr:hypothetical protein [Desulfovibrionaceae bacterium]